MQKPLILLASHLLCLGAGAWFVRGDHRAEEAKRAATKAGERTGSRPSLDESAKRLTDEVVAAVKGSLDGEALRVAADKLQGDEGEKRARSLAAEGRDFGPPPDKELAAAFLAWFRQDRIAALDFLLEGGLNPGKSLVLRQILEELTPEEHLKLISSRPAWGYNFVLSQILGSRLGELDAAAAAALVAEARGSGQGDQIFHAIMQGWPHGKAGQYLEMAMASGGNATALLRAFLENYSNPRRSADLLVAIKDRNDLPEDFTRFLEEQRELIGHLYRYADPAVSLDERIEQMRNLAWLREATPEALREGALKQISTVDINELMKSGPDYRYVFRHGAMTAEEILDAVKKTFPELAAASDYETRVRVYNELASEDAGAAYALLAGLPPEQRKLAVIHQARWSFRENSPETFYSMINMAPGPDSADAAPQREDAWNSYGSMAYRRYGNDYVEWLRTLPPGVNRDVAHSTFAKAMQSQGKQELADEFSAP